MKNHKLLRLFTLILLMIGCSHKQIAPHISREPQSVFTITKIEDHSGKNLQIQAKSNQVVSLKYRLIKPINAGAAKSPATATVDIGAISASQLISDDKGFIYFNFTPPAQAGMASVTIKSGKVQVITRIEVLPAVDYGQLISSEYSRLAVSKNRAYADGTDIIEFKLNLQDKQQKTISLNSQMNVEWNVSDGIMLKSNGLSFLYQVPKVAGMVTVEAKVEGVKLNSVELQLLTTINRQELKILSLDQTQSQAKIKLQLFDLFNQIIQNPAEIIGKMEVSKGLVTYKVSESTVEIDVSFPAEKSNSELTLFTTQGVHQKKFNFSFDNILPDLGQSRTKTHPKLVVANGFDPFEIELELKTSDQTPISTIDIKQIEIKSVHNNHNILRAKKLDNGKYHFVLSLNDHPETKSEIQFYYLQQAISEKVEIQHNNAVTQEKVSMDYYPEEMGYHNNFSINKYTFKSHFDADYELQKLVGFSFTNNGVNRIVPRGGSADADPSSKVQASREFQFNFREQARQNMALDVWEDTTGFTSRFMISHFVIAPRKVIPSIELNQQDEVEVTLTTGEKVLFDKESFEIVGGVMQEGTVDMGPSRHTRTFADLRYQGRGVVIRANARGGTPQLGQFSQKQIQGEYGNIGDMDVMVYYYDQNLKTTKRCILKKKDFWPAKDQSPVPFNFVTDEELAKFLGDKCGAEFANRVRGVPVD
jgi:hypothetical protein